MSVAAVASDDVWAVGNNGHIYHYGGSSWSLNHTTSEGSNLRSVFAVAINDVWAVGAFGRIYHFDGASWSLFHTTTEGTRLESVFAVASNDVWAAGNDGHIYHFDGSSWSLFHTTSEGSTLWSVFAVSSTDIWIVGNSGRIYHFDGASWSLNHTTTEGTTLFSVSAVASDDIWAVGSFGRIYHFDGVGWSLDHTTTEGSTLFSVSAVAADDVWTVDNAGHVYHFDGSSWSLFHTTSEGSTLLSVTVFIDAQTSIEETRLLDVRVRDAFAGHSSEARLLIDDPNGVKNLDYPEQKLVELHVTPSGQPETRRFTGTVADTKRQGQGELEVTIHPHSQWLQKQSILIDFGSRIEQLPSITTGGTDIRDAAVSPDGDHVAFVGDGFGPSPGDTPGRVFKKEDDTYTPVTLLPTVGGNHNVESRAAAYSPDGVHLAVAYVGENFDEQGLAIFKRDGDTYTLIQEFGDPDVQVGNIAMMTYSPDGEHLAFGSIGIPDLFVFKRDGDTYTIIESLNTGRRVSYVSYHPDGDHLAVGRGDGGNTDVVPAIKIFERDGDNYTEVVGLDDVWLRPDDSNGDFDRGLVNYGDDGGLVASVSNEGFAVDATDLYSRRANTYKRTDGFDSSPMLDFEFNHIREIRVHRDSGILAAESDDPETLSFFLRRGRRYLHVKDFDISAEPSGRQEPRFSHDGDHLLIPIWFSGDVLVFALGEFLGDILEEIVTTLTPLVWEPGNVNIANNRRVLRDWRGMKLLDVLVELSAVSENDEFGVTMDREFFWRAKDSLGTAPGVGLVMGEHLDQEAEFSEDTRRRVNRVTVNYGEGTAARRVVLNDTPHQEQLQSRIGSSGPVVEELVVTHTEITREADALSKARELMTQRSNTESGVLVSWDRFDYRPGMSVPVESDVHGVDKTMSIAFLDYAWNDDETRVGVARDYEGLIDLLDSLGSDQGRVENRETRGEVPTSTHEV